MNDFHLQKQILNSMISIELPSTGETILRELVNQSDSEVLMSRIHTNLGFMEKMGWVTTSLDNEQRTKFDITEKGRKLCREDTKE